MIAEPGEKAGKIRIARRSDTLSARDGTSAPLAQRRGASAYVRLERGKGGKHQNEVNSRPIVASRTIEALERSRLEKSEDP